jgi:hypothetical protein
MVEMAAPGAVMFGFSPPSSRGPREEKLNIWWSADTFAP